MLANMDRRVWIGIGGLRLSGLSGLYMTYACVALIGAVCINRGAYDLLNGILGAASLACLFLLLARLTGPDDRRFAVRTLVYLVVFVLILLGSVHVLDGLIGGVVSVAFLIATGRFAPNGRGADASEF